MVREHAVDFFGVGGAHALFQLHTP